MGSSPSKEPRPIESKWFPEFEEKLPSLEGRVIAITGCTSGTGLVAAKTVARKGADVLLMLNRESERAVKAEASVKEEVDKVDGSTKKTVVETIPCDLQSFESVKKAASAILAKYTSGIDVLCNNAGVMALDDYATGDGYDVQMQTNHLSHFLLTKELMPLLQKAAELRGEARVVNHTSLARLGKPLDGTYLEENGGNLGGNGSFLFTGAKWDRYHQSKLANAVYTLALTDKLKDKAAAAAAASENKGKVISTVAAPGLAATNLQVTTSQTGGMGGVSMFIMHFAQSAEDGTMPLLSACFLPSSSGDFWEPSQRNKMVGPAEKFPLEKECTDEASRKVLWEASEEACGKFEV